MRKPLLFFPVAIPLALAAVFVTGYNHQAAIPTVEELSADLAEELANQGFEADVIDCVVGIAERRFRYGSLDAATRDELVGSCEKAQDGLKDFEPTILAPDPAPLGAVFSYGDDSDLDALWDRCQAGEGSTCDELFDKSPLGSDYEQFGLSCGGRSDVLDCSELDGISEVQPDQKKE